MVEREIKQPSQANHESSDQRFEQELLQSELVFSTTTNLREVLKTMRREDPAGLLDITANFQVRDLGASLVNIVSFLSSERSFACFGGEKFIQVLRAAKPLRIGEKEESQGENGIIADWRMFNKNNRDKSMVYDHLHREHTSSNWPLTRKLKEHFEEIGENHFAQFWEALQMNPRSSAEIAEKLEGHVSKLASTKKALAVYGLDYFKSHHLDFIWAAYDGDRGVHLDNFLREMGFGKSLDDVFGSIQERVEILFRRLEDSKAEMLASSFYNELSDDERRKVAIRTSSLYSPTGADVFINEDTGAVDYYLTSYPSGMRNTENGQVEIRTQNGSYIKVAFVLDAETGYKEPNIVEKYINPQEDGISPAIVWEVDKTTGKRKYFCGKISKDLIEAIPDVFFERQDTLFGQIAVAAYSDNLKTSLPMKLPLVKGGVKQNMLEPQMLEFPKLFSGAYLKSSPVIAGFEGLGDKR